MNSAQKLWWEQASADQEILELLQRTGVADCHQLHYLQMITEKLAKAAYWKDGQPPQKSHRALVRFLQTLIDRRPMADKPRVALLLGFSSVQAYREFLRVATPIAYLIESLAPAIGDDPNPEYPWPHETPAFVPVDYDFPVMQKLRTSAGRQLLLFLRNAVRHFPEYA